MLLPVWHRRRSRLRRCNCLLLLDVSRSICKRLGDRNIGNRKVADFRSGRNRIGHTNRPHRRLHRAGRRQHRWNLGGLSGGYLNCIWRGIFTLLAIPVVAMCFCRCFGFVDGWIL